MSGVIYFYTRNEIDPLRLDLFLSKTFGEKEYIWITDFIDHCIDNEIDPAKAYISFDILKEDFKCIYEVFDKSAPRLSLRERVNLLKHLSVEIVDEILSSDDEVDPYSYILIEPNGQTSTVTANLKEELVVENYYNFPFGYFRTTQKITDADLDCLNAVVMPIYPHIQVEYSNLDGPEKLKQFAHHYEIRPLDKNNWFDREEKSELFIQAMQAYQKMINKDLCIYPPNFSEVKNIKGGSDSEEYCVLITALGQERIVYKERRESW
jgi:hypothetical protein